MTVLAGRRKLSPEQIERFEKKRKQLMAGVMLKVEIGEYHEEEKTPFGFMKKGDTIVLVEPKYRPQFRPIDAPEDYEDPNFPKQIENWVCLTHWGLIEKSEGYVIECTVVESK